MKCSVVQQMRRVCDLRLHCGLKGALPHSEAACMPQIQLNPSRYLGMPTAGPQLSVALRYLQQNLDT